MKNLTHFGVSLTLALAAALAASPSASAQATITGPSTWAAGQPTTVTWSGSSSPVCASGVRVTLNLGSTKIQTGSAVPMSAGRASIPGSTLSAGTAVSFTLTDLCSGKVVSSARAVTITGSTAPVVPVAASTAPTITPQVRQNIDTACLGVLGAACSSSASYNSTYTAITQQITGGKLASDSSSIMYSYLIPMVKSSVSWQTNVVDAAWRGAGCSGAAPEAQWTPKVAPLQTYSAVVNAMKAQGCAGAAATVALATTSTQYVPAQQMTAAYAAVWGGAASSAVARTNCPVATGAMSCARSDLAAYVKSHNTGMLTSVAAAGYLSVTGGTLDSNHAQTLAAAFGRNWTGADDLLPYLRANPSLFAVSRVFGGLSSEGCLIDNIRVKLDINEPCGMYFVDVNGAHAAGSYAASFQGVRFTLSAANSGGGVLVDNAGVPLQIAATATKWAIGHNIVAQGGGNIILNAGGNIVAQGGGNIVAQGGGNIVAQGGGNIVAQGGGNLIQDGAAYTKTLSFTDPLTAARTARLLAGGASVISNDGGSFLPSIKQIPAIANIIGENSSGFAVTGTGGVLSSKPGGSLTNAINTSSVAATASNSRLIGENSSGLLTDNGAALLSVSGRPAAVITGPAAWSFGQPAMITWTPTQGTAACASGYRVLMNGNIQTGNPTALSVGKSLVPATTYARGTRVSVSLVSLCNGTPVAAPYTTIIQ